MIHSLSSEPIDFPQYGSCDLGDRLEISYQGCQELNDAMKFCSQSFVTETRSNALVMGELNVFIF